MFFFFLIFLSNDIRYREVYINICRARSILTEHEANKIVVMRFSSKARRWVEEICHPSRRGALSSVTSQCTHDADRHKKR